MAEERLQKIIATAGIASRRKAEELITAGDVTVNGKVVTALGTKAELGRDHIKVFGKLLKPPARLVYLALNKPDSCVTTVTDPEGRKTVMEFVRGLKDRVYPVGRLDYHSEGLLLFTNDGEFANRITSAKFHVQKTYLVKANGNLTVEQQEKFRAGLPISGKRTAPAEIRLHKPGTNPWYEVKLTEGRQNQIRLMFRHLGKLVERLRRVRIGFVELGKLKTGTWRPLTDQEVYKLRHQVGLKDAVGGEDQGEGFVKEVTKRAPYGAGLVAGGDAPPLVKTAAPAFTKAPKPRDDKFRRPKFLAPKGPPKAPAFGAPESDTRPSYVPERKNPDARSRPVNAEYSDSRPPKAAGGRAPGPRTFGARVPGPRDSGPVDRGGRDQGSRNQGRRDSGPRDAGPRDQGGRDQGPKAPFSKAPFSKAPFSKFSKPSGDKPYASRPPASKNRGPVTKNRAPRGRNKPRT